jgi:uncharacterized protein (DUF302 family)
VGEATQRLRAELEGMSIGVVEGLDLSPSLEREAEYRVLIAVDRKFLNLTTDATPGAATLALLKISIYEEDDLTRVDAIEPEKAAAQIRNPETNDRGLELRKRFMKTIGALERPGSRAR